MKKRIHLFSGLAVGIMFVTCFTTALARGTGPICAPDDTMPGCICSGNPYEPELLNPTSTGPMPGTVDQGDYIVSATDLTEYGDR